MAAKQTEVTVSSSTQIDIEDVDIADIEEKLGLNEGALNQMRDWQKMMTEMKARCSSLQQQNTDMQLQRRGSKLNPRGSLSRGRTSLLRAMEPTDVPVDDTEEIKAMDGPRDLDGRPVAVQRNSITAKDRVARGSKDRIVVQEAWPVTPSQPEEDSARRRQSTESQRRPSREPQLPNQVKEPDSEENGDELPLPHRSEANFEYDPEEEIVMHTPVSRAQATFVGICSTLLVIIMCVWADNGLLAPHHVGHVHTTKTRVGHVHSPLYMADEDGLSISLHGTEKDVFDLRIILMASKDFGEHRRLTSNFKRRLAGGIHKSSQRSNFQGNITYTLVADGTAFHTETLDLSSCLEKEYFRTIDVRELGYNEAEHYSVEVTSAASDGKPIAFLFQALRMGVNARWRVPIGLTIFCITFASIVAEKIHRSYSAFMGSAACLALLCAIQETPHLHQITGMIDFGTLMLLFSMMILMHMLASTGFFNWFALKVVKVAKQRPKTVFFLLTNICGWMSMVLDNVTVVLLTGPLTFQIATRTGMGPRPLYLAMTICATIGGTATLIGDPPNIVIGSKMQVGFANFLMVNLPITGFVFLPISSLFLWMRLKDEVIANSESAEPLDYKALEQKNCIKHEPHFENLGAVLLGILLALLTAPVHGIEPSWFTMMGMMACAMMFDRHHMGHFLEFVEWDTLFFFAILFVLVETLSELGVIRAIGDMIVDLIMVAPEANRMYFAIFVVLWLSSMGSAFLESLPFTTTFVYILLDLMHRGIPGCQVELLVWPLSIGACVGGIGSIMGSSANLVCMAVSNRYSQNEEDRIMGSDFLKYGFPTLLLLMCFATVWLFFLFLWVEFEPPPPGTMAQMC